MYWTLKIISTILRRNWKRLLGIVIVLGKKYDLVNEHSLRLEWNEIKSLVEEGKDKGYISEGDAKVMVPDQPQAVNRSSMV